MAGARALRRAAVLRSCPPDRASPAPPPLLHSTQRPATALLPPPRRSGRQCLRRRRWWSLSRASGDRRSEVEEETAAARLTSGDMNGAGRLAASSAARGLRGRLAARCCECHHCTPTTAATGRIQVVDSLMIEREAVSGGAGVAALARLAGCCMIRHTDHCPGTGRLVLTRIKATGDDATGKKITCLNRINARAARSRRSSRTCS